MDTGTLDVRVRGNNVFPPTFLNRLHILLAILRQVHLILAISVFSDELFQLKPEVFVVDQLSACVPFLRWLYPQRQRILFYCHFPDQLLAERSARGMPGLVKKVYRLPFDWFEGWSMSGSDKIAVNSNFTRSIARRVWPSLGESFRVIYPCVDIPRPSQDEKPLWENRFRIILSINRFERKKDVGLAILAYNALSAAERRSTRLILAGGYDQRVSENVQYHKELVNLAEGLGLSTATARTVPTALAVPDDIQVLFLLSVPAPFKTTLLRNARLLLYTPTNEHFGIVPVEAMQFGVPVLASNTGGPLETIVEGKTGWLRDASKAEEWAAIIRKVLYELDSTTLQVIGREGPIRVGDRFTKTIMAQEFNHAINDMMGQKRSPFLETRDVVLIFGVMAAFVAALIAAILKARFRTRDPRVSEFARARRSDPGSTKDFRFFPQQLL